MVPRQIPQSTIDGMIRPKVESYVGCKIEELSITYLTDPSQRPEGVLVTLGIFDGWWVAIKRIVDFVDGPCNRWVGRYGIVVIALAFAGYKNLPTLEQLGTKTYDLASRAVECVQSPEFYKKAADAPPIPMSPVSLPADLEIAAYHPGFSYPGPHEPLLPSPAPWPGKVPTPSGDTGPQGVWITSTNTTTTTTPDPNLYS